VAAVAKLYRDYAWEAVVEEPDFSDLGLFEQPASVLARYFDKHLVDLILRDQRCREKTPTICRLDFQPIWNSQDPGATELKVLPTSDPTTISVEFTYPSDNSHIKLTYHLSRTKSGWKIADIRGAGWSLRSILESTP